jgi:chaperonin GroEL
MTKDTLLVGDEARTKLMAGVKKCAAAVGSTMGTGGSNAIIEAIENPGHLTTNDGASILGAIRLADPVEEMGRKILYEAVSRANKASGDGSSTTTVLTASILETGQEFLGETTSMELKRSLEDCIPAIENAINAQKRDISVDEVGMVAAISAEDEAIGQTIQEIYQQIGKDGIVHWDISKTAEDTYTIGSGITVNGATYASPYMCDATEAGQNTNQIRLKNPKILITRQKITSASDFDVLGSMLFAKEVRDLVVFCEDFEPLIINDLILTRAKKGFRIILVKMPILWKDQWYEDLALSSGATVVDPANGLPLRQASMDQLGTFGNIHITKEDTYIDGIKDLSLHVKQLEEDGTDDSKLRASRLNTKTARYFVGAHSDSALSYRRLKVEDAISAAYQALHGGIVIGGGLALKDVPLEDTVGGKILVKALQAPYEQIVENMGRSFTKEDLEAAHVYDPAPVVVNAAKNAISVAASILTAKSLVLLPREEYQMPNFPIQV